MMVEGKSRIGLMFNTQKASAVGLARELTEWGSSRGYGFVLPPYEVDTTGLRAADGADENFLSEARFAVVIGGDGTFLRAARYVRGHDIPLYGVNVGRLGFLATGDPCGVRSDIEKILAGEYTLQERSFLLCSVKCGDGTERTIHALNEIAVTRGKYARPIDLDLATNGEPFNELLADGIIIATPTGSTAYSLSAGGPIVPPHVRCIILTPICPHALHARPFILGEKDVITVTARDECGDIALSADGEPECAIMPGDRVDIRLDADDAISTISIAPHSYYELLRKKLLWGSFRSEHEGNANYD